MASELIDSRVLPVIKQAPAVGSPLSISVLRGCQLPSICELAQPSSWAGLIPCLPILGSLCVNSGLRPLSGASVEWLSSVPARLLPIRSLYSLSFTALEHVTLTPLLILSCLHSSLSQFRGWEIHCRIALPRQRHAGNRRPWERRCPGHLETEAATPSSVGNHFLFGRPAAGSLEGGEPEHLGMLGGLVCTDEAPGPWGRGRRKGWPHLPKVGQLCWAIPAQSGVWGPLRPLCLLPLLRNKGWRAVQLQECESQTPASCISATETSRA